MKMTDDKKETKQTVKQVFSNNLFLLKLIFKASPAFIILLALDAMRNQISIFFEHTIGIGYVLEAAEFGYPFAQVARFILILAGCITLGMIFAVFSGDYVAEKERPKVREKIKMMLYEKAGAVDLECYDDPEFYNEQVLAISEVDKQIDRGVKFVQDTLAGLTVFITTGIFFFVKDKMSIIFVLISFVMTLVFEQIYNRQNYKVRVESIPFSRKRDYIKRIYYLNDYAKEIRLNPDVSDILFERFEEANDDVYKIEKKYAFKKWLLGFVKGYMCNNLISDCVFIAYLVYQSAVLGNLSFSTVAILYGSFGRLKRGMKVFSESYPFACETSLYINKIRKFMDYETSIVSAEKLVPDKEAKEIGLKGVSFGYSKNNEQTIKELDLNIKPGEKIALVGYNGAGKTTLVKLLMRLYDVGAGEITADGKNIKSYDVKKYRDTIGTVFQDFKIFGGNVRENVILDVDAHSDDEKVREALTQSGLIERIDRYKKGLDTELTHEFSDQGVEMSGGESQKLAIVMLYHKT